LGYDWKDKIMDNINWEEMENVNWEEVAGYILGQEKILKTLNFPAPISVLVTWNGDIYLGSIQKVALEFSDEIVVLSKTTHRLPNDLVSAIRKLDTGRLDLVAEDSLDLDGRQHILRIVGNELVYMTHEQTKYITENIPNICEI
jgi:hypothetical protein